MHFWQLLEQRNRLLLTPCLLLVAGGAGRPECPLPPHPPRANRSPAPDTNPSRPSPSAPPPPPGPECGPRVLPRRQPRPVRPPPGLPVLSPDVPVCKKSNKQATHAQGAKKRPEQERTGAPPARPAPPRPAPPAAPQRSTARQCGPRLAPGHPPAPSRSPSLRRRRRQGRRQVRCRQWYVPRSEIIRRTEL